MEQREACTGNIFIQSHLHDLVRQLMTLLSGRKDKHSVALVLASLVLGNINKTLFQEFIIRVPRNFEHQELFQKLSLIQTFLLVQVLKHFLDYLTFLIHQEKIHSTSFLQEFNFLNSLGEDIFTTLTNLQPKFLEKLLVFKIPRNSYDKLLEESFIYIAQYQTC